MKKLKLTEWKKKVDELLIRSLRQTSDDFPDVNFIELYEKGATPHDAYWEVLYDFEFPDEDEDEFDSEEQLLEDSGRIIAKTAQY